MPWATQKEPIDSTTEAMLNQLEMLDQLDQLDRQDFESVIEQTYQCTDDRDFACADQKLEEAKRLAFDEAASDQVAEARDYRQQIYRIAEEEQRRLALKSRIQECSASCLIPEEYENCVDGYQNPRYCRQPSYDAPSGPDNTMIMLNQTVQQLKQFTENQLAQQRRQLETQQRMYEKQKRQQEQQRREIELRRSQQLAQVERDAAELNERQRKANEERQRIDARRKANERRDAQKARESARQQKMLERQRAREQERAARETLRLAYLAKLQQGIQLRGGVCMGSKVVFGTIPKIVPEEVGCQDVYYNLYCPGAQTPQYKGVMTNMISNPEGNCFMGDINTVPDNTPCGAKEFRVKVTKVTSC